MIHSQPLENEQHKLKLIPKFQASSGIKFCKLDMSICLEDARNDSFSDSGYGRRRDLPAINRTTDMSFGLYLRLNLGEWNNPC